MFPRGWTARIFHGTNALLSLVGATLVVARPGTMQDLSAGRHKDGRRGWAGGAPVRSELASEYRTGYGALRVPVFENRGLERLPRRLYIHPYERGRSQGGLQASERTGRHPWNSARAGTIAWHVVPPFVPGSAPLCHVHCTDAAQAFQCSACPKRLILCYRAASNTTCCGSAFNDAGPAHRDTSRASRHRQQRFPTREERRREH